LIYRLFFKLILQRIDAERAHALAAATLRGANAIPGFERRLRAHLRPTDPLLQVEAFGRTFPTPVGVAAGMDKDATWFESLAALGFGFVEVGTVTAQPQSGNSRPRIWRLVHDRGLLNSMGFPNPGAAATAERLRRRRPGTIVGVNVGKSRAAARDRAPEDYRASVRMLAPLSDFVVLNVSSPNTPGLRDLQAVDALEGLLDAVQEELRGMATSPPLLIKLGPDLLDEELDAIADLAVARRVAGIVAVNTTAARTGLASATELAGLPGGVSGAPLKKRAAQVLERLYQRVGDQVVLISVGGIETDSDAWERILAGATLVQAHTGFVYGGPLWPSRINRGLRNRVRNAGVRSIQELVGVASASSAPRVTPAMRTTHEHADLVGPSASTDARTRMR